jgi:hypothetical protein
MTIEKAKQIVKDAGHEVLTAWETETAIFACSVKSDRACLNASVFSVHYNKHTGWLSVTDRPPVCLLGMGSHLLLCPLQKRAPLPS